MEISNDTMTLIGIIGAVILLFLICNCTLSCSNKESFSRIGIADDVSDITAADYYMFDKMMSPSNWREGMAKKHTPLEQARPDFKAATWSGYPHQLGLLL